MLASEDIPNLVFGLSRDPGPCPFVLGVVGHRDPDPSALPSLRRQFSSLLQEVVDLCPATPIWMLNGLAAGMDSMAADVFLDVARLSGTGDASSLSRSNCDRLIAVLPKNLDDYRHDFQDPGSLSAFELLLQECYCVVDPSTCEELSDGGGRAFSSPSCYASQGSYVAKYAYLLIAFSDGVDTGLPGGTAHTLAVHAGELHPLFSSRQEVVGSRESGLTIVITTPRSSGSCGGSHGLDPGCRFDRLPLDVRSSIEGFNSINARLECSLMQRACYSVDEGVFTHLWTRVDDQACRSKKNYERLAAFLVVFGFALVATAESYGDNSIFGWSLVFIAVAVFPRLQKKLQVPFLINRCLAEGLAIQYLWSANGLESGVADSLSHHDHPMINRVRVILRSLQLQLSLDRNLVSEDQILVCSKSCAWIDGQIAFLENRIRLFRSLADRWRHRGYLLAFLALLASSLRVFWPDPDWLSELSQVLLAGFASCLAYQDLMGYEQICQRYEPSLSRFMRSRRALHFLGQETSGSMRYLPSDMDRYQMVIDSIGCEKIDELNEWMANQLEATYRPA